MLAFRQIVDNILNAMRLESDGEIEKRVKRLINQAYYELCNEVSFDTMRTVTTIDFSDDDDSGMWLPTNLAGIDMVYDETRETIYYRRNAGEVVAPEGGYRYTTEIGSRTPLFSGTGTIEAGATTFTSASLTEDYTGYWVAFGAEPGYYLLTDEKTITPAFNSETQTDVTIMIRPVETKVMKLWDVGNARLQDREVSVYYWTLPTPLRQDHDRILLPSTEYLELATLRKLPEAKQRRPVSENELERARGKLLRMNPQFPIHSYLRDIHNAPFQFSGEHYKGRGR